MNNVDDNKLTELLSNYNSGFTEGFSNRVISKLNSDAKSTSGNESDFYSIFKWIALTGVAAILILLITTYVSQGEFNADAFYGLTNYYPNESIIATLTY